jgi:hypothetical protein
MSHPAHFAAATIVCAADRRRAAPEERLLQYPFNLL